jgi:hypothetical protein
MRAISHSSGGASFDDHAAPDVESHRTHGDRTRGPVGENHASDRNSVAVVHEWH